MGSGSRYASRFHVAPIPSFDQYGDMRVAAPGCDVIRSSVLLPNQASSETGARAKANPRSAIHIPANGNAFGARDLRWKMRPKG